MPRCGRKAPGKAGYCGRCVSGQPVARAAALAGADPFLVGAPWLPGEFLGVQSLAACGPTVVSTRSDPRRGLFRGAGPPHRLRAHSCHPSDGHHARLPRRPEPPLSEPAVNSVSGRKPRIDGNGHLVAGLRDGAVSLRVDCRRGTASHQPPQPGLRVRAAIDDHGIAARHPSQSFARRSGGADL